MKNILYMLAFLCTAVSLQAQESNSPQEQFINKTWHFSKLIIDGVEHVFVPNSEIEDVLWELHPYPTGNDYWVEIGFCEEIYADSLIVKNDSIFKIVSIFGFAQNNCTAPENVALDNLYYLFFLDNHLSEHDDFSYAITEEEDYKKLVITAHTGDKAIYKDELLSVGDYQASQIKIYPNPVQDQLYIDHLTQPALLTLYTLTGKKVTTQKIDKKQGVVSMTSLAPGVYLYTLDRNHRTLLTGKVIKK